MSSDTFFGQRRQKWELLEFFWKISLSDTFFCAACAENFETSTFFWKIAQFWETWRFYCITIHKMTKKLKKTSLYRVSFEICSMTHFLKISTVHWHKPNCSPLNSSPDWKYKKIRNLNPEIDIIAKCTQDFLKTLIFELNGKILRDRYCVSTRTSLENWWNFFFTKCNSISDITQVFTIILCLVLIRAQIRGKDGLKAFENR